MANYIIFDKINKRLITKPFKSSGETFLKKFYIAHYAIKTDVTDIGAENYTLNPKLFTKRFVKILAEAGKNGETIVTYDISSYLSLLFSKRFIMNNADVKVQMDMFLNPFELTTDFLADVIHINTFIAVQEVIDIIKRNLKYSLEGFKAAFYYGADIRADERYNRKLNKFFKAIKLECVKFNREFTPDGYELLRYSPEIAFKMAGSILLDAFDNGADFLIVSDARTFYLMEAKRKEIARAVGREIPIYILTLPQLALIAVGITQKSVLGLDAYKVKPTLFG
jgi:succinate dehydrogenase / fumarate reductase cytochrome b subunit